MHRHPRDRQRPRGANARFGNNDDGWAKSSLGREKARADRDTVDHATENMSAMLNDGDTLFHILHGRPGGPIETRWRACLADSDDATHYTAPEYFCEPAFRDKRPFAILSMSGDEIAGVLTGIHNGDRLQSGLSVRPQIAFSRDADRSSAMRNLVAGLLHEAASAKLVDLFVWHDMAALIDTRFHERRYEGVVTLDLSRGPDALFRKFSANKRTNIKKAIKYGVSVHTATSRDDVSAYHAIYAGWARRKALPIVRQDEFQETFALTNNRRLFLARYEGRNHRRPGGPVLSGQGYGIRRKQLARGGALPAAQRFIALARHRMGVRRGAHQIQPRGRPPILTEIRRRGHPNDPSSPRPIDVSPIRDRRLDRGQGQGGPPGHPAAGGRPRAFAAEPPRKFPRPPRPSFGVIRSHRSAPLSGRSLRRHNDPGRQITNSEERGDQIIREHYYKKRKERVIINALVIKKIEARSF